jgi:hypothetical protein
MQRTFYIILSAILILNISVTNAQQKVKPKNHMHKMKNLQQLLDAKNTNNSIIEIDNFIGEACNYGNNMNVITVPQQKFYINQELEREVNNGGFSQYFINSGGNYAHETVLSLKEIGANKTAAILQKAIDLFPGAKVPKNRDQRIKLVEKIDPNNTLWDKLDQRFFSYEEDLNELNIKFVAKHKSSF